MNYKIKQVKFITISREYIDELYKIDKNISREDYPEVNTRPYLALMIVIGKFHYCIPLSSFKLHQKDWKDTDIDIWIYIDKNGKSVKSARLKLGCMIPVPKEHERGLEFRNIHYKTLIAKQEKFVNQNVREIYKKAVVIHSKVSKGQLIKKCVNFKKLEAYVETKYISHSKQITLGNNPLANSHPLGIKNDDSKTKKK